jgi:hypothetical protein
VNALDSGMKLKARHRNFIVVGLIVGGMATAVFSVIVAPRMNPEEYSMFNVVFTCAMQ